MVRRWMSCSLALAAAALCGCGDDSSKSAPGPGATAVPTSTTAATGGTGGTAGTRGSAGTTGSATHSTAGASTSDAGAGGTATSGGSAGTHVLTFGTTGPLATLPSGRTSDPRVPATQGAPAATSAAARSIVPPEAVQAVNDFVAALSRGELDAAKRFFLSQEEFGQLFRTDAQSSYYTSLRHDFDAAVDKHKADFADAQLDQLKLKLDQAPAAYPAGASIEQAVLVKQTYAVEDLVIDARVGNATRSIYFDYLVKTDHGWRAFSAPDFEGSSRRRDDRRSK